MPVQGVTASLDDTNVDWNSLSDAQVELKAIESTATPIPAADVSEFGHFLFRSKSRLAALAR